MIRKNLFVVFVVCAIVLPMSCKKRDSKMEGLIIGHWVFAANGPLFQGGGTTYVLYIFRDNMTYEIGYGTNDLCDLSDYTFTDLNSLNYTAGGYIFPVQYYIERGYLYLQDPETGSYIVKPKITKINDKKMKWNSKILVDEGLALERCN